MVGIWQRWNICDEEAMLCWSLSIIIKRFSEQIVCNRAVLEWTTQAKNTAIEQKRIRHSPRGNRTTFWFWMHFHEQTDFDGGPVQAHHKWKEAWLWNRKKSLFCYSLLSSSTRSFRQLRRPPAFSSASHSELNQEFTFVPHDLLKQFACHSSNMGSQSFSLPPCVTYLISSRLLHYCSARTILVDARRPSFLGPNSLAFSAISTIIHELFYENFSPQFA